MCRSEKCESIKEESNERNYGLKDINTALH